MFAKFLPALCSYEALRPFFDVSTKLIVKRLMLSCWPSSSFQQNYKDKPDLYGPFWVLNTLIASLFISSNLYCGIVHLGGSE